jgi:ABC-type antimicrobial peptide transport system permease subunit
VALGASSGNVVEMILKRGIGLVAIGIVLGLGGAFAGARFLEDMLYNVEPFDLPTFASVGAFFTGVAIVACLVPAWRALRVNPAETLQAE